MRVGKRLFKVGDNDFRGLQPDRKPDETIGNTQSAPQFWIKIRVRR